MKILITNTYYFPAFVGGAEISVKLLAEGMHAKGNQVYVLTTGLKDHVYTVNGVIVISIKQRNIYNSYGKKQRPVIIKTLWHLLDSFNFLYRYKITAILKRIAPNVVHTNSIQGFSPFLWRIIKRLNIPLVHSMRDYYMLCHKCSLYNGKNCETLCAPCNATYNIKKQFINLPDKFIGISKFILDKYQSFYPQITAKSNLIYNAVDTSDAAMSISKPGQKIVFGYIGRIDIDKGVGYMVDEIAAMLPKDKAALKVIFAGQGPADFIQLLKTKLDGVEFEFLGLAKPADFYRSIDVLVVPALWNEPFGRIVIESLSHMVPVCQSDRGGLKEIYSAGSSWIFSPQSGQLTAQLTNILNNRWQLEAKKLHCINEAGKFSVEKYISKHLLVYKDLTAGLTNKPTKVAAESIVQP